ncbi:MAG: hypothetical protein IJ649_08045 [Oscillospiraceae bacterium]|nr:hypothetical protein [Oscillospiraceae bacterium]
MELYKMIYQRLVTDATLSALLAQYANRPAVFYQHPATSDDQKWSDPQYPRIDYTVDMQENPARNTSGVLMLNVWCDSEYGPEPENVEYAIRDLLHATFAQADDYPYCFAWVRSDTFDGPTDKEKNIHTIGVTVVFDIMAFPEQYTMYPDPIKAMNAWTKTVLPDAVVIGEDSFSGWLVPSKAQPVIYWRLAGQSIRSKHFTHTWLDVAMEGHVYARSAADRLYNLARLNTAAALLGHVPMEDTSPLFLRAFTCKPHLNYLSTGQLHADGNFGLLQPQSHLENKATGEALENVTAPVYINGKTGESSNS